MPCLPAFRTNQTILDSGTARIITAGKEIRESTHVEYIKPDPNTCTDGKPESGSKSCNCKACTSKKEALAYLRKKIDAVRAERAGGPEMITPEKRLPGAP
jgi:hypothetical protein